MFDAHHLIDFLLSFLVRHVNILDMIQPSLPLVLHLPCDSHACSAEWNFKYREEMDVGSHHEHVHVFNLDVITKYKDVGMEASCSSLMHVSGQLSGDFNNIK